jgi:hypothetical protein
MFSALAPWWPNQESDWIEIIPTVDPRGHPAPKQILDFMMPAPSLS